MRIDLVVQGPQRRFGAIDAGRVHSELGQLQAQHFAVRGVVIDDQYAPILECLRVEAADFGFAGRIGEPRREPER